MGTCFSLYFNENKLDGFSEIGNIEGIKNQSNLKIVEEPYNLKEAKSHIKHVRLLIRSTDGFDANRGFEMQSYSFISDFVDKIEGEKSTAADDDEESESKESKTKKRSNS